jgi:dinuclear metal center YbgI/SA1388 family protein
MKIKDIIAVIEKIVPLKLAQDWDNVGLLLGDAQSNVKNILLTVDITKEVLSEAIKLKTDLIISYHPVIWDGLKKIIAESQVKLGAKYLAPCSTQGLVYELIRCGIAVYSIHTALDSAVGGVNDGLAEILGLCDTKPIGDYVDYSGDMDYKLIVFVPADSASKVFDAVFAAGAGWMGNYSNCSFRTEGMGTFLPLEGAKPAVGRKGRIEEVPEIRFETIVPADKLDKVIAVMKKAHPYEMPAFDVFKLYNSQEKLGLGRIGRLAQPLFIKQIIDRIKKATGAKAVGLIGNEKKLVKTAAVCAGSCGKIINSVIAAKADLYLTGELKHHYALAAQQANLTCICLSHSVSERFILKKFAKQLQEQLNNVTIKISKKDADPFIWKNI